MNSPDTAEARLKPSFLLSLAMATLSIWLITSTYDDLLPAKRASTTGYAVGLCVLLVGLTGLAGRWPLARSFVFTSGRLGVRCRWLSRLIGAYAMALMGCYFLFR